MVFFEQFFGRRQRFLCIVCFLGYFFYINSSAVTYDLVLSGRLGDKLVIYCKAKYFACVNNVKLLHVPFAHSEKFRFHYAEEWSDPQKQHFSRIVRLRSAAKLPVVAENTLYVVNLYTQLNEEYNPYENYQGPPQAFWTNFWIDDIFEKMNQEPEYKRAIKTMLEFVDQRKAPDLPTNCITIAVHVRKGTGFDGKFFSRQYYDSLKLPPLEITPPLKFVDTCSPLRFVPEQYYVDQINNLLEIFKSRAIYVRVFTDYDNPQALVENLKKNCPHNNIVWETKSIFNGSIDNVLDELYAMSYFDCLIRPCSHFSGVAQLIGNHKIIIRPANSDWHSDILHICESVTYYRGDNNNIECSHRGKLCC